MSADAPELQPDSQHNTVTRRFLSWEAPRVISALGFAHAVRLDDPSSLDETLTEMATVVTPGWFVRAAPSRQRSYVAGRHCASRALAALGSQVADATLRTGDFGAPIWPAGVCGSITHSSRYAVAVAAPLTRWRGLGIDCEAIMDDATAQDVRDRILPEASTVRWVGASDGGCEFREFVSIAFAAKESVYKCLNPIVATFFEFDAVTLESIDLARGHASLTLLTTFGNGIASGLRLQVDFCRDDGHVFAGTALPANG
jgi:enterobactin synthetase component D